MSNLKEKLKLLPENPGVYIMLDKDGKKFRYFVKCSDANAFADAEKVCDNAVITKPLSSSEWESLSSASSGIMSAIRVFD